MSTSDDSPAANNNEPMPKTSISNDGVVNSCIAITAPLRALLRTYHVVSDKTKFTVPIAPTSTRNDSFVKRKKGLISAAAEAAPRPGTTAVKKPASCPGRITLKGALNALFFCSGIFACDKLKSKVLVPKNPVSIASKGCSRPGREKTSHPVTPAKKKNNIPLTDCVNKNKTRPSNKIGIHSVLNQRTIYKKRGNNKTLSIIAPRLPTCVKRSASIPRPSDNNACPGNTLKTIDESGAPKKILGRALMNVCVVASATIKTITSKPKLLKNTAMLTSIAHMRFT